MLARCGWPSAVRLMLAILLASVSAIQNEFSTIFDSRRILHNTTGSTTCDKTRRTGSWVDIQCTERELTSAVKYTPEERWKAADGNSAWDDAIFRWKNCDRQEGKTFTESMIDFLHADEQPGCDLTRGSDRCGSIRCFAHNGPSTDPADVAGAGAYLVWNSLIRLRTYAKDVYRAYDKIAPSLRKKAYEFMKVFSPNEEDLDIRAMLPIIGTIPFAGGGAMFFKRIFSSIVKRDVPTHVSRNMTKAMLTAGYDAVEQAGSLVVADPEMDFIYVIETALEEWSSQVTIVLENLFSGEDKYIRVLTELIKDGRFAAGRGNNDAYPRSFIDEEAARKAFYAATIPAVWRETSQAPAVIDAGECKGHDAIPDIVREGELSYSCYRDRAYFLVSAPDGSKSKTPMGIPRGVAELDGKEWGRVKHYDIIAGAVETYRKAGNKNNGDVKPDPNDGDIGDALYDYDIRAPGIVNIPVYSVEEVVNN